MTAHKVTAATHDDWRAAKERREDMAIRAALALVNVDYAMARYWAAAYDEADTELRRIGQELDGGA